ncbi:MAG TPA: hypothetical protein VH372_00395 [Actinospica sp.]|nr:hypothetical protein [Actinospica sp.]
MRAALSSSVMGGGLPAVEMPDIETLDVETLDVETAGVEMPGEISRGRTAPA